MVAKVIPSQPVFILDIKKLKSNLENIKVLKANTDCKVLLATKAFAMPVAFDIMRDYLDGTTASGEYEAKLGVEEFGKEVHVYSPAFTDKEVDNLSKIATHIYFNSAQQVKMYAERCRQAGCNIGLRLNPEYSHVSIGGSLYDPCMPGSRFGEIKSRLNDVDWALIDSLHVHALCESMHDGSIGLINYIAKNFGEFVQKVKTVNFGGGHFLNKPGYDRVKLSNAMVAFRREFDVSITLEPGAGLVVDAGELHSQVVAIHNNEIDIAIINASASTHMPDILETPYSPEIREAAPSGELAYTYRIAGRTCMAGDIIGDYSFNAPLQPGSDIVFADQMHYSIVKSNNFNGTPSANLAVRRENGSIKMIAEFGYQDFKKSLGFNN